MVTRSLRSDVEVDKALIAKAEKAAKGLTPRTERARAWTSSRRREGGAGRRDRRGRGAGNGSEYAEEEARSHQFLGTKKHKHKSFFFFCASLWLFFCRQRNRRRPMNRKFSLRCCAFGGAVFLLLASALQICLRLRNPSRRPSPVKELSNKIRLFPVRGLDLKRPFMVRSIRIDDPFDFLPWVKTR